jgi:aromatic-L-amino-acid/L-tryptophan decarboxylase
VSSPHPHDRETLDPEDWDAVRALGHRMVDDALTFLRDVRERPAWRPTPEALRRRFEAPLPRAGAGLEAAYEAFRSDVLPYPLGNVHPRYWGWVTGTGTVGAALGELLTGALNSSGTGFDCASTLAEEQVILWLRDMLGFPPATRGLLLSACSMATLTGLAIARHVRSGFDVTRRGLRAAPAAPALYASTEVHSSVRRAVELLGWGRDALRLVPVDGERRMRVDELERAVERDRTAGAAPLVVVGTAGTVNTGAVDDLEGLAEVAARQDLWLHVDGAFGALAWLCEELRPALRGLQRADSLAFDLHKWMHAPFAVGCCLFRSEAEALATFGDGASYLQRTPGGPRSHPRWFADEGPELTRPARAIKVWMSFIEHGVDRFGRMIAKNVAQTRHLAQRIAAHPRLELLGTGPLNVLCFRYAHAGLEAEALDGLNATILRRVQESGVAVPSHTVLEGRFALRVAITNHRTRQEDVDVLVRSVVAIGDELAAGLAETGAGAPRRAS